MRKSTKIVKRIMALFLVVLMSINTLGALVSDNDGSAFITKAEFDSLKINFQSQIDQYNISIDSKIDGAIASYLAGVTVAKKSILSDLTKTFSDIDENSIYFVNKELAFNDTNNENFTRGGWWLFWIYGWNTAWNVPNGIVNLANNALEDHRLVMCPPAPDSYKFWVKSCKIENDVFYGPYDSSVVRMEQDVYAQRIISTWANNAWHWNWDIRTNDGTFDFSNLAAPGAINLGSYDVGWKTFDNIEGTIILTYDAFATNSRWHIANATGRADNSINNYCIDVDQKFVLTEIRDEQSRFCGARPGIQYQEFNGRTGEANTDGTGIQLSHPVFTFRFKTPKVLEKKNADFVNWVVSQTIGVRVPQYAGLPFVNLPRTGKIKFKYKITTYDLATGNESNSLSNIAFKSKQFTNNIIANENQTDILLSKDNINSGNEYVAEFEIEDAKSDNSTYLYVKVAPTSSDVYAKFEVTSDIEFEETK